MMTSYVWHCFLSYCTKKCRCLLHFSIIMSHSACQAQQCWKQDQSIRPGDQGRGRSDTSLCHKTSVSDPYTNNMFTYAR